MARQAFKIGGETVPSGSRRTIDIPISQLPIHVPVQLSAHIIHGKCSGKTMFVSAAIHGDEIIGVEIIRRFWVRAPEGGILRTFNECGDRVNKGDALFHIARIGKAGSIAKSTSHIDSAWENEAQANAVEIS